MLKKHTQFFESLLFLSDLLIISLIWFFSYYIRFYSGLITVEKGIPTFKIYLFLIIPILFIWGFVFKYFGLYRPKRMSSYLNEAFDIAKACTFSVFILIFLAFLLRQYEYSRLVFLGFWMMTIIIMNIERIAFREILRYLRRKGYNLRYALIVGTGALAEDILKRIELHPELGVKVVGFLKGKKDVLRKEKIQSKIIGNYEDINNIISEKKIDQVFIALSLKENDKLFEILKALEGEMVEIRIVPDLYQLATLHGGVEEFEGVFLINLQGSPLYGWNRVMKRASDIIFSLIAILIMLPIMLIIAVVIKLTSKGLVFYKQTRMGLDGKVFQMLKFRTMRIDAEKETGPVWARKDDPRSTRVGSFLRRTSLDELPQFINVFKGDMSIVGPRPERPVFIEDFRKKIPKYMLRHKMKAGITGWAQVNGWRGNTDLKKRIEYDLFYIKNWSFLFDVKIMWLTVWKGLINRNAY